MGKVCKGHGIAELLDLDVLYPRHLSRVREVIFASQEENLVMTMRNMLICMDGDASLSS